MAIASKKKSPHHSNVKSILRLGEYREPVGGPTGAVTSCAAKTSREEVSMDTNVRTIRKLEEIGPNF